MGEEPENGGGGHRWCHLRWGVLQKRQRGQPTVYQEEKVIAQLIVEGSQDDLQTGPPKALNNTDVQHESPEQLTVKSH